MLAVPDETAAGGSAIQPSTLLLAHSTAVALYRDASQSLRVRGLAFCLWRSIRRTVNPSPVAGDMVLTYMCGNVFRVRNRGLVPVILSWDVYGTTERGTVSIGASTLQWSAKGVSTKRDSELRVREQRDFFSEPSWFRRRRMVALCVRARDRLRTKCVGRRSARGCFTLQSGSKPRLTE